MRALLVSLFVVASCPGQDAAARPARAKPNFLVILCDDLGYGDLACYGHETIATPHLDALARQGVRLTDCYTAAPVCSSARAGILTGRTPNRCGVYDWIPRGHVMHLPKEEVTVATLLGDAGYATCHVGKWHLNGRFNQESQPQPGDHGFDHWFATQNNAGPSHANPKNFVRNGEPVGRIEGYSCQIVADEAIRWLRDEREAAQPFFQFVCFHEPHEPVASPPELVARYPEARKRGEALYYANVTNMDRAVGRLMAALDELELARDTLVIFTSDNGPETLDRYKGAWRSHGSPGPLRGMKLHIYEGGIRVPGIARWPGRIAPDTERGIPVSGVDLLPTLCGLAGVALPADRTLDGVDVSGAFTGSMHERPAPLFWWYQNAIGSAKVALRSGSWKLVALWDVDGLRAGGGFGPAGMRAVKEQDLVAFELYHLGRDLDESEDVKEQHPKIARELTAALRARYDDVRAEGPEWKFATDR